MYAYPGSQEGQHLVDQLIIGKVSTQHHGAEDVCLELFGGGLGVGDGNPLFDDDVLAQAAQEAGLRGDDIVEAPGKTLGKPLGEDEVDRQEEHLLLGWFEDAQEAIGDFVLGVLQGAEVSAHGGRADNVEREPAVHVR